MKDPAVLFYTADFLTGTAFFDDTQRGQYIRLLCEQHQIGHIPENHMLSVCFSLASPVVSKFKKDENGMYFNERMELEIIKRRQFSESRSINGKKGGRPRLEEKPSAKANKKPSAKARKNLVENGNINESINKYSLVFDEFRKMYPGTKRGNETEFENFKKKHSDWVFILKIIKDKLLDQINARQLKSDLGQFVPEWKNLQTWINQRCWEDEIAIQPKNNQNQPKKQEYIPPSRRLDKDESFGLSPNYEAYKENMKKLTENKTVK